MIGLTAGLTLLVSALGSTLVMWLPVIILSTLGSAFTFSFFHWVWAKLNRMVGFKKEKGVEVFYDVNEKVSKNGKLYRESNGDKFFHKPGSIYTYVITKEGHRFSTDSGADYYMGKYKGSDMTDVVKEIEDELEEDRSDYNRMVAEGEREYYKMSPAEKKKFMMFKKYRVLVD